MLYIDDRQGSGDLPTIPPLTNLPTELCTLDSADVFFVGNGPDERPIKIGIEVKELGEFIGSLGTGRVNGIEGQLPNMRDEYDLIYLLIYGRYRCGPSPQCLLQINSNNRWITYSYGGDKLWSWLESAIMSIELFGIKVAIVDDKATAARWIHVLYNKLTRKWSSHSLFKQFNHSSSKITFANPNAIPDGVKLRARIMAQFPMIRFDRAMRIARYFNSTSVMLECLAKEPDRLIDIKGIGKGLVNEIIGARDK